MKFLLIFLVLLMVPVASAHMDAGSDIAVNGYLIDFGYNPKDPIAGKSSYLNFNLLNESTKELIPYTSAWVRVSGQTQVVFTGSFAPERSNVGWQQIFPKQGSYEILVRFFYGKRQIVEQTFEVNVKPPPPKWEMIVGIVGAILVGIFARRRN